MNYVDVLLPVPLDGLFTYSVPSAMAASAERGRRVLVPFGRNKTYVGLVVRRHGDKPQFAVKDIKLVLDEERIVTDGQLELWRCNLRVGRPEVLGCHRMAAVQLCLFGVAA